MKTNVKWMLIVALALGVCLLAGCASNGTAGSGSAGSAVQKVSLSELAGTYQATSAVVEGKEQLTEEVTQREKQTNKYLKLTITEDGGAFFDNTSTTTHGKIDPDTMTVNISGSATSFAYENGALRFGDQGDEKNYAIYEKDETMTPVVMLYVNKALPVIVEDPYLLPWSVMLNDEENFLLFDTSCWLSITKFAQDDTSHEFAEAKSKFSNLMSSWWTRSGTYYAYEETDEAFFQHAMIVGSNTDYYVVAWCPLEDRDTLGQTLNLMLMENIYIGG